jgi:hypothetical protein
MSFVPSDLFSDQRPSTREFERNMQEGLGDVTLHEIGHQLGHPGHTDTGTMTARRTVGGPRPTGFSDESMGLIRPDLERRAPDPPRRR